MPPLLAAAPAANRGPMFSNLKAELASALAMAGALLLSTGYFITWAQLTNAGLPGRPILSALPNAFFVSTAIGAVGLPLVLMVVLIAPLGLKLAAGGSTTTRWWIAAGVLVALVGRGLTAITDPQVLAGSTGATTLWSVAGGVMVTSITAILGKAATAQGARAGSRSDRLQLVMAALLVAAVAGVAAFRISDAGTVSSSLPSVAVFLDTDDCPSVFDAISAPRVLKVGPEVFGDAQVARSPKARSRIVTQKQCNVLGFYVGENDHWLFVAESPDVPHGAPGRLLLVPRDHARLAAVANTSLHADPKAAP